MFLGVEILLTVITPHIGPTVIFLTGVQFDLTIDKESHQPFLSRDAADEKCSRCCRLVGAARSELLSSSADLQGPQVRSGHMSNASGEKMHEDVLLHSTFSSAF
jgi:hypothetical protein